MEAYEGIDGYQRVLEAFGHWPTFHDGEVLRVVMDRLRRFRDGSNDSAVELVIHGFSVTFERTSSGHCKLDRHHLVHFLFKHISDLQLDGLNHQNALARLSFEQLIDEGTGVQCIRVCLEHCYGLAGQFKALRGEVVGVQPCDPNGVPA